MRVILSLPIYSCSKEKFKSLYEKRIERIANSMFCASSDINRAYTIARNYEWKKGIWKYNQIIGYLEVFLHGSSLAFNAYLPEEKNIMKFSNVKKYLRLVEIYGFYVQIIGTNNDVAKKLLDKIKAIEKSKKWHLDYGMFNMVYKDIDYLGLIEKN